jgi:hypothetical protein
MLSESAVSDDGVEAMGKVIRVRALHAEIEIPKHKQLSSNSDAVEKLLEVLEEGRSWFIWRPIYRQQT